MAQHGDVDADGEIVDRVTDELLLRLRRLRGAICPESPIDLDAHLSMVDANLVQAVAA